MPAQREEPDAVIRRANIDASLIGALRASAVQGHMRVKTFNVMI
jgi:hypothetical protein